jgi:hypothetical protein
MSTARRSRYALATMPDDTALPSSSARQLRIMAVEILPS